MLKTLTLLIFFFKCTVYFSQSKIESPLDSVNKYLAIYDTIYSPKTANKYLYKAFSFAKELNKDSLLIEISSYLAYDNVLINNKMGFDKANNILLKAYKNKKDSTALSLYYQNKGWYFENNASVDSAYYYYNKAKIISKASQSNSIITIYYSLLENNLYAKDYLGVEELAIEIIGNKNFNDEYVFLAETYAFLGVVSSRLHNYDDALKYHQKGLKYIKKISDKSIRISEEINNTNNIGSTYLDQNKFNKSLYYFNEALKLDLNLKNNDIEMYAVLLVNKGVSEIKSGKIKYGLNNLNEALNIAEELKTDYIKVEILLELASYYKKIKNSTKAKEYVYNAMTLAKKTNFKQLKALKLSAEIYTGKKSIEFYEKYINLQEEIKKKEQTRKNKFARVRFETQKKEEENNALKQEGLIAKEKIKNEQNKNNIISLIALISFLLALFVFIFYKSRQKILAYKANLGKAKAREQERQEIAVTLHDKVVGDLRLIYERALKNKAENIAEPLSKVNSEIRSLSHKLSSVNFDEVSFKNQLINLVSDYFSSEFKIKALNLNTINWSLIEPSIKRTLYLAIRESIQNSKKYAFASEVIIEFKKKQNTLQLSIKDNGKGFDLKTVKFGLGLKNQKKRVEELNGKFSLESVKETGTTTIIEMPLKA